MPMHSTIVRLLLASVLVHEAHAAAATSKRAIVPLRKVVTRPIEKVLALLEAVKGRVVKEERKALQLQQESTLHCFGDVQHLKLSGEEASRAAPEAEARMRQAAGKPKQLADSLRLAQQKLVPLKLEREQATARRDAARQGFDAAMQDSRDRLTALQQAEMAVLVGGSQARGSSFAQTEMGRHLHEYVSSKQEAGGREHEAVLRFLEGEAVPLVEAERLEDAFQVLTTTEESAQSDLAARHEASEQDFADALEKQEKEESQLSDRIKDKMLRLASLNVDMVTKAAEFEDDEQHAVKDPRVAGHLRATCAQRVHAARQEHSRRHGEVSALSGAIQTLAHNKVATLLQEALPHAGGGPPRPQVAATSVFEQAATFGAQKPWQMRVVLLALRSRAMSTKQVAHFVVKLEGQLLSEELADTHREQVCVHVDQGQGGDAAMRAGLTELAQAARSQSDHVVALDQCIQATTQLRERASARQRVLMRRGKQAKHWLLSARGQLASVYGAGRSGHQQEEGEVAGASLARSGDDEAPPAAATLLQLGAENKITSAVAGSIDLLRWLARNVDAQQQAAEVGDKALQEDFDQAMADVAEIRIRAAQVQTTLDRVSESFQGLGLRGSVEDASSVLTGLHAGCRALEQSYQDRMMERRDVREVLQQVRKALASH